MKIAKDKLGMKIVLKSFIKSTMHEKVEINNRHDENRRIYRVDLENSKDKDAVMQLK